MSRLRQQHPQNYSSSGNISSEFEHLIRYLNRAELGNKTVAELLSVLFDDDGIFDGPIELRREASAGIQVRIGEYTDPELGWTTLASMEDIRGEPGLVVGQLGAPVFMGRVDLIATAAQDTFDYAHEDIDELVVYVDGVLMRPGGSYDYTTDDTGGSGSAGAVIFNAPMSGGETVTVYKVRTSLVTGYIRQDTLTTTTQGVFPFPHEDGDVIHVYKNGILLREGGSYDYVKDPASDTVTMTVAVGSGNLISIVMIENTTANAVTGMMFESRFCDLASGLILFNKLLIENDAIPVAKVNGLSSSLSTKAKLTVLTTPPVGPAVGDFWLDTAASPNIMKFYDGANWNLTAPETMLPTFYNSDANKYVRVNGSGTALVYESLDLSSVVAVTQKGAANGVASLDSSGRLPYSQLPEVLATESIYKIDASPANGTHGIKRVFGQLIQVVGMSLQTSSGTVDFQVAVNGVGVGSVYTVSSTPLEFSLGTTIDIDSTSSSDLIGYILTSAAAPANLEITLALNVVSS